MSFVLDFSYASINLNPSHLFFLISDELEKQMMDTFYAKGHPGKLKILSCSINSVTMELALFQMNIGASEWGIIILLVVLVIMGSKGFSGLARLLGRAVGEYDKARETFRNEKDFSSSGESVFTSVVPQIRGPVGTESEKLKIVAKALGIEDSDLSDDQLRSLISRKIQRP